MWDAISHVLTSPDFLKNIPMVVLLIVVISMLVKFNIIKIRTAHVQIGGDTSKSDTERAVIREQCDYAHTYLLGLYSKIEQVTPDLMYDGYFTRYILEVAYDEFVRWITFNHITDTEDYISTKQAKICALVYSMGVRPEFKTPEFRQRMCNWTEEIIRELVRIRKVYTAQAQYRRAHA